MKDLEKYLTKEEYREKEPLSRHTTFRIGGNADWYITPKSIDSLQQTILLCIKQDIPYYVIGKGSNILFSDRGFRGAVIEIGNGMKKVEMPDKQTVCAEAGISLVRLSNFVAEKGLSGFEFASGIPGNLGGALVMNAGAYGQEMKDCVQEANVMVLTNNGVQQRVFSKEELDLSYRHSLLQDKKYIVLSATLVFEKGAKESIFAYMKELSQKRKEKQPLEYPSAGSTFKRPEGYYAGKLIEDAGLRGYCVGGAQVSEKHCGFVINRGGATADDVHRLICEVQKKVNEKFGVELEPEVRFMGECSMGLTC